ncbi:hypothetical protein K440DRAFT_639093 [Wilcoxina mikolae CBS 423.85]|nr:hypothetical protein K440DRAFT_639093 [Wilcoxina mikolae CBS 423.85]
MATQKAIACFPSALTLCASESTSPVAAVIVGELVVGITVPLPPTKVKLSDVLARLVDVLGLEVEPPVKAIDGSRFGLPDGLGTDREELPLISREVGLTLIIAGNGGNDIALLELTGGVRRTVMNVVVTVLEVSYHPIFERISLPTTPDTDDLTEEPDEDVVMSAARDL